MMNKTRLDQDTKTLTIVDNLFPHQNMPGDKMCIDYFMNSHDDFIVMSSSVQDEITTHYKNKNTELILHPVYDNYGDAIDKSEACELLDLSSDYRYILFFGFIKPYKGLDLLLRSIDRDYFQKNKIKLLIAGEVYGSDEKYHKLIKELKLEAHIEFHNHFITDEMVKAYFSVSDLIAQTYLSATQSGISQIALHFEKPVLVTNVGGLSEMVIHDKTGYVVDKDKEDIKNALHDFFDHNRSQSFAPNIVTLKAENTWERFAEKLLSFIFGRA